MDPIIKVLVLKSGSKVLVTQIKEIPSELGEPDCQLTDPVEFKEGDQDWKERLQRWPGKQLTQKPPVYDLIRCYTYYCRSPTRIVGGISRGY